MLIFEKTAGLCFGIAALGFGTPTGTTDAAVGLAGLVGNVLSQNQKFGPECPKVLANIRKETLAAFEMAFGREYGFQSDEIKQADNILHESLALCMIDRESIAAAAVHRLGFPKKATGIVMDKLAESNPEWFGEKSEHKLAQRYAKVVVETGLNAAASDERYFRRIEPHLVLKVAQTIGKIEENSDQILSDLSTLPDRMAEKLLDKLAQGNHLKAEYSNAHNQSTRVDALNETISIMSDFIVEFSYNLRAPITNIVGFSDLLKHSELEGQNAEYAGHIYLSAQQVLKIIDDVLEGAARNTENEV